MEKVGASPRKSRDEQAAASRRHIAETALRLFAGHGFSKTSTRRIAAEAGVSEGLVFHHFPTKLSLLRGALDGGSHLPAEIASRVTGAPDAPVGDQIRAFGAGFVRLMRSDRVEAQLFRVLLGEAQTSPVVREMLRTTTDALVTLVGGYLRGRIAAGEVRADLPVEAAVRTLQGAFLVFFVINGDLDHEAWDERAAAHVKGVIDVWLRGVLA